MTSPKLWHGTTNRRLLLVSAWAIVLLISDLPDVIWNALFGQVPAGLFWAKVGVLCAGLLFSLLWKPLRPLWQFTLVFLVFYLALAARTWIGEMPFWQERFGGDQGSFTMGYLDLHLRDLGTALVVIAALWLVKRQRREFFLAKGQTDAPIEPVRWLGIGRGESWRTFGWIFALCAGLAILIVVLLSTPITTEALLDAAPLLPIVLLLAALNAFAEEVYYRASMLSTLKDVIGNNHALLLNVVFFGLAHYLYGSPPGIMGFALTGFLAFLLGKSILETKGLLWAWIIHFVPDAFIFAWYALDWVQR